MSTKLQKDNIMYISPYTAVDAAMAVTDKSLDKTSYETDCRATVIDLLSHLKNTQKAQNKHETDQIFSLGYN